ncbi:MAG: TetR/AcrR family transcriptional regulator [Terracidiphilus sp.]
MARTRSSEAHDKVLRAALDLFIERGIEGTSMDAIAQASGVSKATIYNHWTDKEALLMEVMVLINGLDRGEEEVDTGDIRKDLTVVLTRKPPGEFDEQRNRLMPALIAYSAVHQEFGKAWRQRVLEPPQEYLRQILRRGMKTGVLRQDFDLETGVALLFGPMMYAHILQRDGKPERPEFGKNVAEAFWRAHSQMRRERIKQTLGEPGSAKKDARKGKRRKD